MPPALLAAIATDGLADPALILSWAERLLQRDQATTSVGAFIPLNFAAGEAYQFDWSQEVVLINSTTMTVKVAQVGVCHSRMLFVRA